MPLHRRKRDPIGLKEEKNCIQKKIQHRVPHSAHHSSPEEKPLPFPVRRIQPHKKVQKKRTSLSLKLINRFDSEWFIVIKRPRPSFGMELLHSSSDSLWG